MCQSPHLSPFFTDGKTEATEGMEACGSEYSVSVCVVAGGGGAARGP